MELVEVGRNAPCPCGSGRKYKKCCLAASEGALGGDAHDLDAAALVDRAIDTDDWSAIHDLVDVAMETFEGGGPLEGVRFRDDVFHAAGGAEGLPEHLCSAGWLAMCEREIALVLARYDLEPAVRDGLRMAAHLVRRFGAQSPIVEELAALQADEDDERRGRLASAMEAHGVAADGLRAAWSDVTTWLEHERPAVLSFAQWFALRVSPDTMLDTLWLSGLARRVCDACLEELERGPTVDAPSWGALTVVAMMDRTVGFGVFLARHTPARAQTDEERLLCEALAKDHRLLDREGIVHEILRATEARGDFADAALLRETMRVIQHTARLRGRGGGRA